MPDPSIVDRYFTALCSANGALAGSLFRHDGVLDDYRGGHRVGPDVITAFIDARPPRTLTMLADVVEGSDCLTAYTRMDYADGRSKTVRFTFRVVEGQIQHLINSDIEFVPEELAAVGATSWPKYPGSDDPGRGPGALSYDGPC